MIPVRGFDESLQGYAYRTRRSVAEAYADWHTHGAEIAAAWQMPCTAKPSEEHQRPHTTIASGAVCALRPEDVAAIQYDYEKNGWRRARDMERD